MKHTISQETWFGTLHTVIEMSTLNEGTFKYLVLGDGLIPLHKHKTINDRDIVYEAKCIIFGRQTFRDRLKNYQKS